MFSFPDPVLLCLTDPTRRALYERLARHGEQTVWMLTARAGISQPAVSRHLKRLEKAGLVQGRHEGRETLYRIEPRGLDVLVDWIARYSAVWREKLDSLEEGPDSTGQSPVS